jgi:hypothetical protein
MNVLLIQTILAARNSEGDDTIWVQILVLVILAVSIGIFSLAKTKANKVKGYNQHSSQRHRHWQIQPGLNAHSELLSSAPTVGPNVNEHNRQDGLRQKFVGKTLKKLAREREKDLHSGMELLGLDFLLSIIENTNGDNEKDVIIRKLNFKELLRRGKLNQADSNALKIYAINKGNLYGKDIQREAMKSLAERTAKSTKHSS